MSQSLRVAVCSNCGHFLVRAASCSGNPTRNRTWQYSSRRWISWGSLFDHLKLRRMEREKGGDGPGGKERGAGIEVEESRRRAERIAREVRLKKEKFGRATVPPTPSPPPSVPPVPP